MRISWIAWFALAAVASAIVMTRVVRGRATSRKVDVGSLSDQWVAEHRASQTNGSTR
jgi:hypothetical protein